MIKSSSDNILTAVKMIKMSLNQQMSVLPVDVPHAMNTNSAESQS